MKKPKKWVPAAIMCAVFAILIIACLSYTNSRVDMANRAKDETYKTDMGLKDADIVKLGNEKLAIEAEKILLESDIADKDITLAEKDITIVDKDAEIAELESKVSDYEVTETELASGYVLNEIAIDETVNKTLSDKQISLFDGKVECNDKDCNAQEFIALSDVFHTTNGDYEENTYLEIGGFRYVYEIKNRPALVSGETLEINLVGKDVVISSWENGVVTFTSGEEFVMEEGETRICTVDGIDYEVEVTIITDTQATNVVKFKINGETTDALSTEDSTFIFEDDTEIAVIEILPNEAGDVTQDLVTFKLGKGIAKTIKDEEKYDEDDNHNVWLWEITPTTIGLINEIEFNGLDENELEFNALGIGESICLPDFKCIEFNGLTEETTETYKFDIYEGRDNNYYVRITGNFYDDDLNDYSTLYIRDKKIYKYENKSYTQVFDIELGDTEIALKVDDKVVTLKDFNFEIENLQEKNATFINAKSNGEIDSDEENYRTNYGSIIDNPEDLYDEQEFSIVIPVEQLFGTITVY